MESPKSGSTIHLKRHAAAPPSDISEPVQKARRIDASSSSDDSDMNNHQPRASATALPPEVCPSFPYTASSVPHSNSNQIWMHILESIDHSHHVARPAYVNCFTSAIIQERATEADLVPELPAFERQAWKATRPYYAIDEASRQVAKAAFLSGVLLQTCTSPLNQVPLKRNLGRREPHAPRTSIPPPFYPPNTLAKMQPKIQNDGTSAAAVPTYMPLELFDIRLFHEASIPDKDRKSTVALQVQMGFMGELFKQHVQRLTETNPELLRTVRRVDLLAAAPYESLMKHAELLADVLTSEIEEVWEDMGILDGVVRVLH